MTPLLVVADRWLNRQIDLQAAWCRVSFLCSLAFPSYFLLIFVGAASVLLLVAGSNLPAGLEHNREDASRSPDQTTVSARLRRIGTGLVGGSIAAALRLWIFHALDSSLPGWDFAACLLIFFIGWAIREAPLATAGNALRKYGTTTGLYILVHLALAGGLVGYLNSGRIGPVALVIVILAGGSLALRWRRVHPVFWIMLVALVVQTADLNSWAFSAVGDEFSFYAYAREIVEKQNLAFIGERLFWGTAVFGSHPYFSSLLQGIIMRLTDVTMGWRFSSVYVSVLALPFFYVFFRTFVAKRVALLATFLLAVSQYLMTFGKIGYNNTQALLAMGLTLAATGWAIRSNHRLAYVAVGAAIGFCFYVYPTALYVPLIAIILLDSYQPILKRKRTHEWLLMLLTAILFISPLLLQRDYWTDKVAGTFFNGSFVTEHTGTLGGQVMSNLIYSLFSFLYIPEESHFVTVSYVDPLTAVFVLVGIALTVRMAWRSKFAAFMLIGGALLLFLVGASHDRAFPPATRMFLLLPWFMLFAALGMEWFSSSLIGSEGTRDMTVLMGGLGAVALLLNLYMAYHLSIQRSAQYQGVEEMLVRLGQNIEAGTTRPTLLVVNDPSNLYVPALTMELELYNIPLQMAELKGPETTPADASSQLFADNTLVIMSPRLPDLVRGEYEDFLAQNARTHCEMRTVAGKPVFSVWYPTGLASPCPVD